MKRGLWLSIATASGFALDDRQIGQLEQYRSWLLTEAIPAGGIGPDEGSRLDERHIGDSLLFSWPFSIAPTDLLDIGTGVGLPGIPLAVLWPATSVTLLDRSGKRVDLAKRAARVLGLDNIEVIQEDIEVTKRRFSAVVSRGALPPERLTTTLDRVLRPGGMAVAAGSWTNRPAMDRWETMEIPAEMLDRPVWLLIMRRA